MIARLRTSGAGGRADHGSATLEFLAATILLLLPVLYLVVTVGRVQAATFAAEAGAYQAARVMAAAPTTAEGVRRAEAAVRLALDDQGFDDVSSERALTLSCSASCLVPGGTVGATVDIDVNLPLVPGFLLDTVPLAVPVRAEALVAVDDHRAAG